MAVRVLGPLDIGAGPPLSPRERTVLSALIVAAPGELSAASLADSYWHQSPPATWPQQVKTSVNRIRARAGAAIIRTTATGYRFGLDPEAVDAVRFERLVSAARGHVLHGDPARAADAYRRALALWRGNPYPELADWEQGRFEAARLLAVRDGAEEELIEARLGTGEARTVVPDAERLVREQPLREERWALLALANYRADRQAEALAVLRGARRRLDEDLGIEPGARLVALETAILRQDPALAPRPPAAAVSDQCPYRGLRAFGPEDADVYAGRETDVERVLGRLRPGALVAITGPSGSGKSSLMLAGVIPVLREGGRTTELARAGSGADGLRRAFERVGAGGVVALDQAEELFTPLDPAEIESVCAAAAARLAEGVAVIATVRSDFVDAAVGLPHIGAAIARDVVVLGPLDATALRAAVVEPATRAGLRVEPGLVEVVMRDLGARVGALPHLSHALVETWQRREGATLTVAGYTDSGGIAGAIAQSAERMYGGLSTAERPLARSLLLRLLERDVGQVTVRRPVPIGPLVADPARHRVLQALVAARLVSVDEDTALVAHEAVATAWPRLDDWLTADAADARLLRQVELAAAGWSASGRSEDELMRGARLHAALEWRDDAPRDLTEAEEAFLSASEAHERTERRAQQVRAQRDRIQNRRLRWALGAAAGLLVIALAAGGTAVVRGGEVAAASVEARIAALTSTSLALRTSDLEVAALLAVEGYRRWPEDARVRSALWGLVTAAGPLVGRTRIPDADAASAALVTGTRQAAVVRDRRIGQETSESQWESDLAVVDIDTGAVLRRFDLPGTQTRRAQPLRGMAVSRDGRVALVQTGMLRPTGGCCMNQLDFVELSTGRHLPGSQVLDSRTGDTFDLSPDGSHAY
ncbi:MAG: BTAD domain-containing putative transcriptional regulator, partial [Propionicimonas sp.]|nr:BTAD domain-containing putative transcriptional regulator [Propionicimonas sp.]